MEFEKRKAATLTSLASEVTDKSPKGTVDAPIIPLLDVINRHRDYFTTSSCSARISILSQPTTRRRASKKKASGGSSIYISHDIADPGEILNLFFRENDDDDVVFRFEPLIVAVECRDVAAAQLLVSKAIAAGFGESGITNTNKRVIIAIRCSIRLEAPLGSGRDIMASREYLRFLVRVANEKFEATGGFVATEATNPAGSNEALVCSSLSVVEIQVLGEAEENVYLWGHTACLVGDHVFVIGGRADPEKILSDVWVLDVEMKEWKLVECSGDVFPPRFSIMLNL